MKMHSTRGFLDLQEGEEEGRDDGVEEGKREGAIEGQAQRPNTEETSKNSPLSCPKAQE